MAEVDETHRGRLNMRVRGDQEHVMRAAAELRGETLTAFVLSAATERAETVIADAQRITLDAQTYAKFVDAMNAPTEDLPAIRRYAQRESLIPGS